jgi:hypothetical protein
MGARVLQFCLRPAHRCPRLFGAMCAYCRARAQVIGKYVAASRTRGRIRRRWGFGAGYLRLVPRKED